MSEVFVTGMRCGKTALLIKHLEERRDVVLRQIAALQKTVVSFDAVITDLRNGKRLGVFTIPGESTRLPKGEKTVPKMSEVAATIESEATFTTTPPEVRVRVKAPEDPWDGKTAGPHVTIVENAMRDAVFFLFGRRTGPGYALSLKPPQLTEDGKWIETRVRAMPRPDEPRDRIARSVQLACDRARRALLKAGTKVDATLAQEATPA